ncbi:uncharacterized protein [Heptranchias perlo]|uniref:uncharacterized protein n=1 Tax=Heptranchias perlo TaxID=212740 RepID=UPI003559BE87
MGGGSSKWKKISAGPPEPGEYSKASSAEKGDGQRPGEVGKSSGGGGGQQRPVKTGRKEVSNSQDNAGTTSGHRLKGDGSDSPDGEEEDMERELDRALAECEDWWVNSSRKLEPGSCPRSNTYTWSNSRAPCSEPGFNSAPYIQSLAGRGDTAAAASREKAEPLLGSVKVQLPLGPSQRGERDPAAQCWATALTNSNLNINHWNQQHDLLTISTQDIENNNLANGFHINAKNMSPNSAPILYDYSEQELMASIENEYS